MARTSLRGCPLRIQCPQRPDNASRYPAQFAQHVRAMCVATLAQTRVRDVRDGASTHLDARSSVARITLEKRVAARRLIVPTALNHLGNWFWRASSLARV
jgi:hypothetical protein